MKNKLSLFLVKAFCFFSLSNFLYAVPPFPGLPKPEGKTCFINRAETKTRLAALRKYSPGFAPPITATTYKLAVIRTDFSGKAMTKTLDETRTFFDNFRSYFSENSFTLLTVTATITSVTLPKTHGYYANGMNSKYAELARDAIAVATSAAFDFSTYDHLMIYHAGEGSETALSPNNYIWSAYAPTDLVGGPVASGKTFPGVTFVSEKEFNDQGGTAEPTIDPFGVLCHEYGHQLGLPDLYSTATGANQVGKWSLMDYGSYTGTPFGSNPTHLDAWSKQFLGFSSPETISSQSQDKSLLPAETTRNAFIRLPVTVSNAGENKEYFLLEYRKKSGASYDTGLPAEGLIIWHVDDSIAQDASRLSANNINTDSTHRGVDVVEADSTDPSAESGKGDAGDPWPGSTNNTTFKASKSNAYNGYESGIEVSNILGAGSAAMTVTIKNPFNNPVLTQTQLPGNVLILGGSQGYSNTNKGESTLVSIVPAATGTIEMKAYTLTGDLVWETSFAGTANQQRSIPWNGKNSDGTFVSSGIYLLHISGGGIDIKKKVAIAR